MVTVVLILCCGGGGLLRRRLFGCHCGVDNDGGGRGVGGHADRVIGMVVKVVLRKQERKIIQKKWLRLLLLIMHFLHLCLTNAIGGI